MSEEHPDERAARELAEQRDADLLAIMSMPQGRRFLFRFCDNARLRRSSHAGEHTHATAFNEGVREMGLRLDTELRRVSKKLWLLMLEENEPGEILHRRTDS